MDHTILRSNAKASLSGAWIMMAAGTLVYWLLNGALASGLYSLLNNEHSPCLIGILFVGTLSYGYVMFVTRQVDTKNQDVADLFSGFHRFVETMVAGILVSIFVVIGTSLFIIPGIIAWTGLSQTFFIMADDPKISGTEAVKKSWAMMNGYKWDYFVFILGFIGWAILSIITLGIGFIWLYPYMTASGLNYYRKLKENTVVTY